MVVPSSEAYRPLRAPELRWLCTQRGLSPYGFKQDLVARLDEQDRQGVESSSECIAAGLEPFRELEELASQYAANPNNLSPVSVNPRVAATPKTAAKAKEPPQTKATPEPAVEATPSAMAPAQAKMPPMPMPMPQPGPAKPLTEDERALRGLLEFFACSDVKGQSKLFAVKYREFVRTVFDFFQSDTVSGMTGTPTSRASTAAAAAVSAAAATTDAILRGNIAEAPDGAANPNETWSAEMWQKCQEVIATHLEVCHLQIKHDALFAELEAMSKAAAEKTDEIKEVQGRLDQLMQNEAQQRQHLMERARVQIGAWLDRS
ncbi:Dnajb9 [Symbiodinium natans]|uniref:Dnajb9 protein n=1 Tax=Symbiodinium natans TaxID=878477 RepID=A0A812TFA0_9DINO|nr:Dnajb9 [Symbiodinium natans]